MHLICFRCNNGLWRHTACFFTAKVGVAEHAFHQSHAVSIVAVAAVLRHKISDAEAMLVYEAGKAYKSSIKGSRKPGILIFL